MVKNLEKKNYYQITLVDDHDKFEYIPSLPSIFENPKLLDKYTLEYAKIFNDVKHIKARVSDVSNTSITLNNGTVLQLRDYDHVCLCTGSHYDISVIEKNFKIDKGVEPATLINGMVVTDILNKYQKVLDAKSITIVGSGAVGVEVCGSRTLFLHFSMFNF